MEYGLLTLVGDKKYRYQGKEVKTLENKIKEAFEEGYKSLNITTETERHVIFVDKIVSLEVWEG